MTTALRPARIIAGSTLAVLAYLVPVVGAIVALAYVAWLIASAPPSANDPG